MSSKFIQLGHVFVHKNDDVNDYPQAIFTDPKTFVPFNSKVKIYDDEFNEVKDDENIQYCVKRWGLSDPSNTRDPSNEVDDYISNIMKNQNKSFAMYNKEYPAPDIQFINLLAKERKKTLKSPEMQELCNAMYRVRIMIKGAEELCYRVFTVPASTHLNVLHDQIIVPIMGWCRGLYSLY